MSFRQIKTLYDIGACRTAALGAHLHVCDDCRTEVVVYNSCLNRHCPKCGSVARDRWLAARSKELLPAPYCHVIFTLPHELIPLALQNPKVIYGILFRAVSKTLLSIAADPKHLGAKLGFLAVLHTWNQKLLPHPHIHCLVPAGGLALDQTRWIQCRYRSFFLPVKVLGAKFRGLFLALLRRAFRRKELRLAGKSAALQDRKSFDRFTWMLKTKEWVVYAKKPFTGPQHVIQYLAHYTHRVAIANGRLLRFENGQVTFRWRDSVHGNQQKAMTVTAVEFMHRFLRHVLPRGFVKIRHFGFLANRERKHSLPFCLDLLTRSRPPLDSTVDPITRRSLERRRCPHCKRGTLVVVGRIYSIPINPGSLCPLVDSS